LIPAPKGMGASKTLAVLKTVSTFSALPLMMKPSFFCLNK
jgi:hypothetical protein